MVVKKRDMNIKAGPFVFKLTFDSDGLAIRAKDMGPNVWGFTVFASQEIWIRDDMAMEMERETVFHELNHIANFITGIDDNSLKILDEEHIVRVTSPMMYNILDENPELVSYLFGGI